MKQSIIRMLRNGMSLGSLFAGIMGIIFSIAINFFAFNVNNKVDLPSQIREVEEAIGNLKNLEKYLENTKRDIVATKQAKDKIEEEYSKARELEKLTDRQLTAISLAVNKRTKMNVIMNYFSGLVMGIAGSLLASYIYGMFKRKKDNDQQEKPKK